MNLHKLRRLLCNTSEHEHVEFKTASNDYSLLGSGERNERRQKNSVYGYAVALGNEGGGLLVLGVNNQKEIVGTSAIPNITKAKEQIFNCLGKRIDIDEFLDEQERRVLVIHIPPRGIGEVIKFYGIPLMRVGEELHEMDDQTQRNILLEQDTDFSAQIVSGITMDDVDSDALGVMQALYERRHRTTADSSQLLNDLGLRNKEGLTYAALILLGTEVSLRTHLPNAEIIFQYRNSKDTIEYQDRVDYRAAFFRVQDRLWDKIVSRNQITQMQEGFFTPEIPAFNEKVTKEIILNAVTHRDYKQPGSIIIKQSPQEFTIQSPGGFLPGVTPENIIRKSTPRNRLLAEALQHVGLVQRAGQGMDTVFEETIKEGKGIPDFSGTDKHDVVLTISAQVKNPAFLQYLERVINEKQVHLSLGDIVLLQEMESGDASPAKEEVQSFLDIGIVEQVGRTKGTRYMLSHNYYTSKNKQGEYTRLKGLSRDVKKQLILEHLRKNEKGAHLDEFAAALPELSRQDISNMLQELKRNGFITKKSGNTRGTIWGIK